jgi:mono/diheme cytochrome c family protein
MRWPITKEVGEASWRIALLGCRTTVTLGALALTGCDESQVWHTPDPSLARMQEQPRQDPFDTNMSAPPPFTVARGVDARRSPPPVTRQLVERGRQQFETFCAVCHGARGDGESVVATKMLIRRPPSLLEPRIRAMSDDRLYEVIARGYGLMPSYANELPIEDGFATVAYVRALQVAQGVDVAVLPASDVAELARVAP